VIHGGVLARAFAIYRRNFAAVLATAAIALLPADLLASGAVRLGTVALGGSAEPRGSEPKVEHLRQTPPGEPRADAAKQLSKDAIEPPPPAFDKLRPVFMLIYAGLIVTVVLIAGIALAHAALSTLVLDLDASRPTSPHKAWAAIAHRLGPLASTCILGLGSIAIGTVFCLLPGVALAVAFSLAAPVTMVEGVGGRAALERSWRLMKGHWPVVSGLFVLLVAFGALGVWVSSLTHGSLAVKQITSALVRLITFPLPLIALVLLYAKAVNTSAEAPLPDSSAPGSAGTTRP
jgi:hypothetical protein